VLSRLSTNVVPDDVVWLDRLVRLLLLKQYATGEGLATLTTLGSDSHGDVGRPLACHRLCLELNGEVYGAVGISAVGVRDGD
jgi:hypothetical protein